MLSPGRYPCMGSDREVAGERRKTCIVAEGVVDIVVDGQGAILVGRDMAALFQIRDSRNVTIRNLTVDWHPLPHTSGRVVKILPEAHAFDMAPLIPTNPLPGRIVQGVLAYDPQRHRLADNAWEVYQTQGERDADPTQLTPDGHYRVFQSRAVRLPEVGWHVIVRHQVYGDNAFVFANCTNVRMEDVTVHASPGMAVLGWGSRDLVLRRLRVVPFDGGWMSATADAMHFNACRGTIIVEDSEFCGMGDDALNIHAMYGLVAARIDDRTLAVQRGRLHPYCDTRRVPWDPPAPGDILEYGGGDEPLISKGQLTVATAAQDTQQDRRIVTFQNVLPVGVGAGTVLANISASPSVRVRRCCVRGNRARGMLFQTRDVVVEDCLVEDVSGAGVQICADARDWWESVGSRNVTVHNCSFRRCNFGVTRRVAALDIFSDLAEDRQSAAGVHQRLRILGNTFESNTGSAIHVGSADGVEIRQNRFVDGQTPAIKVINSRNVTIDSNTVVSGQGGIEIQGNSDRATINVSADASPDNLGL